MKLLRYVILVLFLALAVSLPACGHHHHGGGVSPPSPASHLATPYHAEQIGVVSENITDICRIGDTVFLSPYLHYSAGKVYRVDTGVHAESLHVSRIESVYRIWSVGGTLFAGTEQPPMVLKRPWKVLQKYSSHGWAVLGNVASDGSVWRGWSYRGQPSRLYRNDKPFPSIPGRIVWWVESYGGKYYAGTSGNTTYKNANDGRIYVFDGAWKPMPTGPIGGAIVLKNYQGSLFVGTCHPQSILRYNGTWQRWNFSGTEEVSKFWTDGVGLFTATTEGGKLHVRQYYKGDWQEIWSVPAHSTKWGPQGVAWGGKMIVVFRDGGSSRIWKIMYR